jgi:hypothetical protein
MKRIIGAVKYGLIASVAGAALAALGVCYSPSSKACGPATLRERRGLSPALWYTCTDPGATNPSWKNAANGEKGWDQLQYIDYECTYSCLGYDPSGTLTWPLPSPPPSASDYPTSNLTPFGNVCYGGGA